MLGGTSEQASASASNSIYLGRASLELQTPAGLADAFDHFSDAVNADPNNLEANLLKAATLLALEQSSPEFQQQLISIGVSITNPNIYDFEYQIPVDSAGAIMPTAGVSSSATVAYLNSRESLIDSALSCLGKFGNDSAGRAFRIRFSSSETSLADVRVDYGDVLILRSLLKVCKAAIALANSYDINAEYALFYRLIKQGELTPQKVLSELPNLLKFADKNRRASVISWLISANRDYQAGYAFTKGPRLPPGNAPYLFGFADAVTADAFAAEVANIIGDLATGEETYLYSSFYPWFVRGLTVDTADLMSSNTPPRDYIGSQFTQGFPTRTSWLDESFGGVLPEPYSRGVLLDEFDLIIGQLIDSDGDGLSDSWERGYGRYEVVAGQFIPEWAAWDSVSKGGHIATFTTQAEWDWFWRRYWREVKQPLYLGLVSDSQQPANWQWWTWPHDLMKVSTEAGSFFNWAPGQPSDDPKNVVGVLDPDLTWRNVPWHFGQYWDQATSTWVYDFPAESFGYVLEKGYPTNPSKADTDNDGFNDRVETIIGSDPNNPANFPTGLGDTVTDGIPDSWWASNNITGANRLAFADPDSDGLTNMQEYVFGTVPTNAASRYEISVERTENGFRFNFDTAIGRTFQPKVRRDLTAGTWENLGPAIVGDGTSKSALDGNASNRSFYRVEVRFGAESQ